MSTADPTTTPDNPPAADYTAEQLAELAELFPNTSPDGSDSLDLSDPGAVVRRLLDDARAIVEYMKPVDEKNKRRIRLYLLLNSLGVPNGDVAKHLDVTPESVRQVLFKARRGRDGT
jgi:hypothetical protein